MTPVRIVLCGGASAEVPAGARRVRLDVQGAQANVELKVSDITVAMAESIPDVLLDLLEVALYVFAADQATHRGGRTDSGDAWYRDFRFHIPVRRPDLWSRPEVSEALTALLRFVSEDSYHFTFSVRTRPTPTQLYFKDFIPTLAVDEVLLFSGGIDSLAGALQEAVVDQRRVALVNHSAASKRRPTVTDLMASVRALSSKGSVHYVPVLATKAQGVGREYTQRTRSFLYAAIGATVASMAGLARLRFYENGVTSMNLPLAPQVLGARASRTTHPRVIQDMSRFLTALLQRPFTVENPFIWQTKTDVVRRIRELGAGSLIAHTVSCSHTFEASNAQPHCGRCSQCLDRRFAVLAAGLTDEEDPSAGYKIDLLTGARQLGEDRAMVESFVQRADTFTTIPELDFFLKNAEVTRILARVGLPTETAATHLLDLHRRHGADVIAVLGEGLREHVRALRLGTLPDSCLLVLCFAERYRCAPSAAMTAGGQPTFRREGQLWHITFEDHQVLLNDYVGLRYIATLLSNPGRPHRSRDLFAFRSGDCGAAPNGSAGALSDEQAVRAYRARLEQIQELLDAGTFPDPSTPLELREEAEKIQRHLNGITGLGGRLRTNDDHQRTRRAVSAAVRRAMKTIGAEHAPLWRHLRSAMKVGSHYSYEPHPEVAWLTS